MPRKPNPNASEYLRRVLNIPTNRTMTGHELQRLDFAKAVLGFIVKEQPTRKQMAEFIKCYNSEDCILPKVCYAILKALKGQTIVRFDEDLKIYSYNRHRYHRDLTALKAFHQQVKVWKSPGLFP